MHRGQGDAHARGGVALDGGVAPPLCEHARRVPEARGCSARGGGQQLTK